MDFPERLQVTRDFYFNADSGNDQSSGTTPSDSWKTLSMLENVEIRPGDKIYLAAGQTFEEPLILKNMSGNSNQPITISTFKADQTIETNKAFIKTKGFLNAVHLQNPNFIHIENLSISAGPQVNTATKAEHDGLMRNGLLVDITREGTFGNLSLKNLEIRDVFFEQPGYDRGEDEVTTANGTQRYGWGIRFINNVPEAKMKRIEIDNVVVENVSHTGIKFTGHNVGDNYGIEDVRMSNSRVLKIGGPGIQMSGLKNGLFNGNTVDQSGSDDDSRKWGRGSGLWTWSSSDILIEKNRFTNANGPGDSAGAHIDFNCRNIVLQYNFSANNAGGFCEILGNNYNCSYRYNISVNDGHRIKGKNGAFQEGKVLWLSGYAGMNNSRKGPFNSYVYNNTIYVGNSIQAKVAIDRQSDGILIANNIFHIEGNTKAVEGDQYNPESRGDITDPNPVFKNNLFLHSGSWPDDYKWQDSDPLFGNVAFENPGALVPEAYTPKNTVLVKNKGIDITTIPGDDVGLFVGLKVMEDFLGNPIKGQPDLGAIAVD